MWCCGGALKDQNGRRTTEEEEEGLWLQYPVMQPPFSAVGVLHLLKMEEEKQLCN